MNSKRALSTGPIARSLSLLVLGALGMGSTATSVSALTIDDTFLSSITGSSDAADIEAAIDFSSSQIAQLYSNNATVNILFGTGDLGPGGLGQSNMGSYRNTYSNYTGLLTADAAAHPANTTLSTAVANLQYGNDANGSKPVVSTSADLRALGQAASPCFNASGSFVGGCGQIYDGVVTISSTKPFNYSTSGPIPAYNGSNTQFSAVRTLEHEIDEILGGGGPGSTLNDIASGGSSFFTGSVGGLDLYRYSAFHTPGLTTGAGVTAYFSVDGGSTEIVGFNQNQNGDYADFGPNIDPCGGGFGGPAGLIQDAFSCRNETPEAFSRGIPEDLMLESLGYNPTPLPSTWLMLLSGLASLGFFAYRGTQKNAAAIAAAQPKHAMGVRRDRRKAAFSVPLTA